MTAFLNKFLHLFYMSFLFGYFVSMFSFFLIMTKRWEKGMNDDNPSIHETQDKVENKHSIF